MAWAFGFDSSARHSGRPEGDPESIGGLRTLRWIPELRFAASGMTEEDQLRDKEEIMNGWI
jgi:hypothetical protein